MADVKHNENNKRQVGDEEVLRRPRHKGREALRDNNNDVESQTVPREPRLERRLVGERVAVNAGILERLHETNVADDDASPGDESCNRANVLEPVENRRAIVGKVEEAEQAEHSGEGDRKVRHTATGRAGEEAGRATIVCKADSDTRARVDVRVGSRQDNRKKYGVDQTGQDMNTSSLGSDDEGRGGGVSGGGQKGVVVVGNEDADEEDSEHKEEEDTVEGLLDRRWDRTARVSGLTSGNTNQLSSLVGETSLNKRRPEADEFGGAEPVRTADLVEQVGSESTGMVPIVEADIPFSAGTCVNADGEDHEAEDGNDLDCREPKLDFAIAAYGSKVYRGDDDPKDSDKNTDRYRLIPILDDDASRSQFQRKGNCPTEPVDPSHGEPQTRVGETCGIRRKGTSYGQVGGHLTQRNDHRVNKGSDEGICDECAGRARLRKG